MIPGELEWYAKVEWEAMEDEYDRRIENENALKLAETLNGAAKDKKTLQLMGLLLNYTPERLKSCISAVSELVGFAVEADVEDPAFSELSTEELKWRLYGGDGE